MNKKDIEEIRNFYRESLLLMLDNATNVAFGLNGNSGSADADLPRLFDALDVQIDAIIKRNKLQFPATGEPEDADEAALPESPRKRGRPKKEAA